MLWFLLCLFACFDESADVSARLTGDTDTGTDTAVEECSGDYPELGVAIQPVTPIDVATGGTPIIVQNNGQPTEGANGGTVCAVTCSGPIVFVDAAECTDCAALAGPPFLYPNLAVSLRFAWPTDSAPGVYDCAVTMPDGDHAFAIELTEQ